MNQFESVKAAVPLRQAAETYGLSVSRNGMTCCPFHEDRHTVRLILVHHWLLVLMVLRHHSVK